jgi:hypothetical protein
MTYRSPGAGVADVGIVKDTMWQPIRICPVSGTPGSGLPRRPARVGAQVRATRFFIQSGSLVCPADYGVLATDHVVVFRDTHAVPTTTAEVCSSSVCTPHWGELVCC